MISCNRILIKKTCKSEVYWDTVCITQYNMNLLLQTLKIRKPSKHHKFWC